MDSKAREQLDQHKAQTYAEEQLEFLKNQDEDVGPEDLVDENDEDETLKLLTSQYRLNYDEIEAMNDSLKLLKQTKEVLSQQLYDALTTRGLESIRTEEGSFAPLLTNKCSVKPEMMEDFFLELEELGMGNLIKRKVEWQTLNAAYRNGQLDTIVSDDGDCTLKVWSQKGIRIRRS